MGNTYHDYFNKKLSRAPFPLTTMQTFLQTTSHEVRTSIDPTRVPIPTSRCIVISFSIMRDLFRHTPQIQTNHHIKIG